LGLALVRRIVELHDGVVTVESQVGQGSQFTIYIPYRQCDLEEYDLEERDLEANLLLPSKSAATIASSSSTSSPLSQHTTKRTAPLILLAEDNEIAQEIISEYLSARGYQLITATNGLEAIQQVRTYSPQLILMDLQMPQVDGLTAIQQIRADWTLAQVPIVALTALAMAGDQEKCLAMGATYYMTKPVKLKQLLALIQKSLCKRS
jgi:CheY-like chemotaxis protein